MKGFICLLALFVVFVSVPAFAQTIQPVEGASLILRVVVGLSAAFLAIIVFRWIVGGKR